MTHYDTAAKKNLLLFCRTKTKKIFWPRALEQIHVKMEYFFSFDRQGEHTIKPRGNIYTKVRYIFTSCDHSASVAFPF